MPYIKLHSLQKSFEEEKILFQNLSLTLSEGDICGIIGRNGEGKSTLFKIITGEILPESGSVEIAPHTTIGCHTQFIPQDEDRKVRIEAYILSQFGRVGEVYDALSCFVPSEETIEEFIALQSEFDELGGYVIQEKIPNALTQLGLYTITPDTELHTLSGGQKTRLQLAKVLIQDPDILLLDEPTNHLDYQTLLWLEKFIQERKGITIIISHDRTFLNNTVTKILEIERGKTTLYLGNYDDFIAEKEKKLLFAERQSEIASRKANNLKDAAQAKASQAIKQHYQRPDKKKYGRHSRTIMRNKAGKKMRQVKHMQKRLETEVQKIHEMAPVNYRNMKFTMRSMEHIGDFVLRVQGINVNVGDKTLIQDISLAIHSGERILIRGSNGSGKTTFLKEIIALYQQYQLDLPLPEDIKFGGNVRIGYFSQEHESIAPDLTLLEDFKRDLLMNEAEALPCLYRMAFDYKQVMQKTGSLSQGEKSRFALAKLLAMHHNFLLLDEPTNHLDIKNKEILENSLLEYDGSMICISHDRYFVEKLSFDSIYEIQSSRLVRI